MNYPKVCVDRRLNGEQQERSVSLAIRANANNLYMLDSSIGKLMAVEVHKMWPNGKALTVGFLNGDSVQQYKCQREAKRWSEFANVSFVFTTAANPTIRVAFYDPKSDQFNDQGSWSYVGTDCGLAKPNEQTVNLGWLDKDSDDAEWQRVVVHEFGHVLGLIHEDQQPAETIQWNKDAVYKYFEGPPNNWTKQDVDDNVLNPTPADGVSHTDFDQVSIMAYQIPPEFTLDNKGVAGGNVLSDKDKAFISTVYPFRTTPNTLTVGAQQTAQVINATHNNTVLSLPISENGTYRIWTSLVGGKVVVTTLSGNTVVSGQQQVTFAAEPQNYTVTITPQDPSVTTTYRVRAAKIS